MKMFQNMKKIILNQLFRENLVRKKLKKKNCLKLIMKNKKFNPLNLNLNKKLFKKQTFQKKKRKNKS